MMTRGTIKALMIGKGDKNRGIQVQRRRLIPIKIGEYLKMPIKKSKQANI